MPPTSKPFPTTNMEWRGLPPPGPSPPGLSHLTYHCRLAATWLPIPGLPTPGSLTNPPRLKEDLAWIGSVPTPDIREKRNRMEQVWRGSMKYNNGGNN